MNTAVNGENGVVRMSPPEQGAEMLRLLEVLDKAEDKSAALRDAAKFLAEHPEMARERMNLSNGSRAAAYRLTHPLWAKLRSPYDMPQMRELERELAGDGASPIVRSLAQLAATEYLWLSLAQMRLSDGKDPAGRLTENLQRRYLRTLKMLATVRRLERGMDVHVTHHLATGCRPAAVARGAGAQEQQLIDAELSVPPVVRAPSAPALPAPAQRQS